MKKKYFFFIILLLLYSNYASAEKRALIIAIGKYPSGSGWSNISGDNDQKILVPALKRQGFTDICNLPNEQATKKNVVSTIKKLTLDSKLGDIVVLHFSTHGQQVKDIDGDEVDNMDEAIVCYDTPKKPSKEIQDSRYHLLDDELKIYLVALRQKLGVKGQLLCFFDACHSNSMQRGVNDLYRGTYEPFVIRSGVLKQNTAKIKTIEQNKILAPAVYFSACQSNELNKEANNGYGSLTYAVAKIFNSDISNYSIQRLFGEIQSVMKLDPVMKGNFGTMHIQNPVMTGDSNYKLFAGTALKIPKHFSVENIKGKVVTLNGGKLAGISPGTIASFYPPDIFNPEKSKPYFVCKIDSTDFIQSFVTLRGTFEPYKIKTFWAFISTSNDYKVNALKNNIVASKELNFKILPVTFQSKTKNNEYIFNPGDTFKIQILNRSASDLYYQLVNVNDKDEISIVVHQRNESEEFKVKKGENKIPDKINLLVDKQDFGKQTLFLICSEKPIDLSSIESTKRGLDNFDFEELLLENKSRGASSTNKIYIGKVNYNVVK